MDIVDAIGKQNMKREIAFLRDKLKSQNEEIESLQEQLNHYAGTIQDMNKEIEDLRIQVGEARLEISRLDKLYIALERERDKLKRLWDAACNRYPELEGLEDELDKWRE